MRSRTDNECVMRSRGSKGSRAGWRRKVAGEGWSRCRKVADEGGWGGRGDDESRRADGLVCCIFVVAVVGKCCYFSRRVCLGRVMWKW